MFFCMAKISIKEASKTLGDTVSKFKTAQDNGTMTPDEVIEAVAPIIEMAATIAEIGSEIQESVPGGNDDGGINGIQGLGNNENNNDGNNNNNLNANQHNSILSEEERQNEEKDLNQRLSQLTDTNSQLQAQIDEMKDDKEKEKLAQKYAQFFPVPMRESKIQEFLLRPGSIQVLQAQVQEAELNMGAQKAVRQAQIEEGTFDLSNYEDNNSSGITAGGKY